MSSKRYSSPVEVRKIKKEPLSDSEDNISTERSHRHSSSRTSHRHEKESRHGENRRRRHSSGESDGDRRERRYERPKEKDRESHHRHVKREPSEERRSLPRHRTERNEAHIKVCNNKIIQEHRPLSILIYFFVISAGKIK